MKKGSITSHPLFGIAVGIGLAAAYGVFESAISPAMFGLLGEWWTWIKQLLFFVLLGLGMKFMLWRALPREMHVEPMTPADFAGISEAAVLRAAHQHRSPLPEVSTQPQEKKDFALDFAQLDARSRELEALGFELQVEGAARTNTNAVPTFARMYRHPEGTWGEIYQVFPRGMAPTPVIFTLLTYFENDWSSADSTMKPNWVLQMIRRPRSIGRLYEPQTSAAMMIAAHRERNAILHQKLGVRVLMLDINGYFARGIAALEEGRRLMLWRSILVSMLRNKLVRRDRENWKEVDKYAKAQTVCA
jgi:hypothetical protein